MKTGGREGWDSSPEQLSRCPRESKQPWGAVCILLRNPSTKGAEHWQGAGRPRQVRVEVHAPRTDRVLCVELSEVGIPETIN